MLKYSTNRVGLIADEMELTDNDMNDCILDSQEKTSAVNRYECLDILGIQLQTKLKVLDIVKGCMSDELLIFLWGVTKGDIMDYQQLKYG